MNRSTLLVIMVVLLSFNITSCNKESANTKLVVNESTKNIKILILRLPNSGYIKDSFIINAKSTVTIENIVSDSGPLYGTTKSCVSNTTDSIITVVISDNNLKVTKDLNNTNSWILNQKNSNNGIDMECKATITDADIVPK